MNKQEQPQQWWQKARKDKDTGHKDEIDMGGKPQVTSAFQVRRVQKNEKWQKMTHFLMVEQTNRFLMVEP